MTRRPAQLPAGSERAVLNLHSATRAVSWLRNALPGAETIYHRGLLMLDRLTDPALDTEAKVYYLAAREGYAELKQTRSGPGSAYLVTRTDKRLTEAREELLRAKLLEEHNV